MTRGFAKHRWVQRRVSTLVALSVAGATLPAALVAVTAGADTSSSAAAGGLAITVLSNRADLVSGGTALVEVTLPAAAAPATARVTLNGADVTGEFAPGRLPGLLSGIPAHNRTGVNPSANALIGVVSGLALGNNSLIARLPNRTGARLTITNHPIGGPVFAGPQAEPWLCTTTSNSLAAQTDGQCDAPTVYTYQYKNAVTGQFDAYDPTNPPPAAEVATTTTDQGHTVPYIVRDERGTIDRGIYDIAVLFDPGRSWAPWATQPAWDHKLGFTFGGGCAPGHSQASAQNPVIDKFLSQGYMVGASSIDVNGNSCNAQTSAESLMMIKEHITKTYGLIRFTIGDGCSGGAEQQNMIAEKYPGLLDGIRPECDFPDFWTPAMWEKYDCELFTRYFDMTSPQLWTNPADRSAVLGGPLTPGDCAEQTALNAGSAGGALQDWDPTSFECTNLGAAQYNPTTNPHGTRCTLQDYNVNSLGRRAADGFANRPIDNVGVQWGLQALLAGKITTAQFVDLNQQIGDWSIDYTWQPQRSAGDVAGIARMYRNDELSYSANWALVPEIDARADDTYDEHSNVMREIDRARLDSVVGSHASQVFWTEPAPGAFGGPSSALQQLSFTTMDQWLSNIEADTSSASQQAKVVNDRPAAAVDSCMVNAQPAPQTACDTVSTSNVLPVMVAGAPLTANIIKCQLKPLNSADYLVANIHFTAAQWTTLQQTFPNGVCDWTKPGVGQQAPVGSWLSYSGSGDGQPLGPAPASQPIGRTGAY